MQLESSDLKTENIKLKIGFIDASQTSENATSDASASEQSLNENHSSKEFAPSVSLVDAAALISQVELEIRGFVSGFAKELATHESLSNISLRKGDRGCRVSVQSFAKDGEIYALENAKFLTERGESNAFKSPSGKVLWLTVVTQLQDPIAAGQSVAFALATSQDGGPVLLNDLGIPIVRVAPERETVGANSSDVSFFLKIQGRAKSNIAVAYELGGTAVPGVDYVLPNSQDVSVTKGKAEVRFNIRLRKGKSNAAGKTIIVTLKQGTRFLAEGLPASVLLQ